MEHLILPREGRVTLIDSPPSVWFRLLFPNINRIELWIFALQARFSANSVQSHEARMRPGDEWAEDDRMTGNDYEGLQTNPGIFIEWKAQSSPAVSKFGPLVWQRDGFS